MMIQSFPDLLEQDQYAQVTTIKRTVQMVRYVVDIRVFTSMLVLEQSVQKEKDLLQVIVALRVEHPMFLHDHCEVCNGLM